MAPSTSPIRTALSVVLASVLLAGGCGSDPASSSEPPSGLYGPCGRAGQYCADGLSCVPARDDPTVFVCTRSCTPGPKCPGVIALGDCWAMLECGQGCCEVNNTWTQSDTTVTCSGAATLATLTDGFCQPWR